MATAHLLFGFIGAGKTTLARQLEFDHQAVRFSPDEWMVRLFGRDPPQDLFGSGSAAILDLLEPVWTRCLKLEVDVVLDFGFWRRAERDRARRAAAAMGATTRLYGVECSETEAWARVEARNRDPSALFIAPETFSALRARLEPPTAEEGCLWL